MNADGQNIVNLSNNDVAEYAADWSPDGQHVIFIRGINMYTMTSEGTGQALLLDRTEEIRTIVRWSPSNLDIVWAENRVDLALWIARPNGTGPAQIATVSQGDPAWSPNGDRLVWTSDRDIQTIARDGTSHANLTNDGNTAWDRDPSWSPDGTKIAFGTNRDGDTEIYVMNADGSSPTNLTSDPGGDADANWGPCPP